VTISFVPDGTIVGSLGSGPAYSNLFATMNARFGSPGAWEPQILLGAQAWAMQTNLNLYVVPDNGTGIGQGPYEQGDPNMGDIRISGYALGDGNLAETFFPPQGNNFSIAGDMQFNTTASWNIGSTYDLFTVAAHEFGHAFGLADNTTDPNSSEYLYYNGIKSLDSDDIAGIRAIYSSGQPRSPDAFLGLNSTWQTSTDLTGYINSISKTVLMTNLDISGYTVPEWFVVQAPSGTTSTPMILVQTKLQSMLFPSVEVFSGGNEIASGSVGYPWNGSLLVVNLSGITAGQMLYIEVGGDTTCPFCVGNYALALNFGTGATPSVGSPYTTTADGSPLQSIGANWEKVLPASGSSATSVIEETPILQVMQVAPAVTNITPVQPSVLVGPTVVGPAAATLVLPALPPGNGTVAQPAPILTDGETATPVLNEGTVEHSVPVTTPAPAAVTAEPEQAIREVPLPVSSWLQASSAYFGADQVRHEDTAAQVGEEPSSMSLEAAIAVAGFVAVVGENRIAKLQKTTEEREGQPRL